MGLLLRGGTGRRRGEGKGERKRREEKGKGEKVWGQPPNILAYNSP